MILLRSVQRSMASFALRGLMAVPRFCIAQRADCVPTQRDRLYPFTINNLWDIPGNRSFINNTSQAPARRREESVAAAGRRKGAAL